MTSFVESLTSKHGESWLGLLRSVISRSTNSLNNKQVKDAKIFFLREFLLLCSDREILEKVKSCDEQFLYDNFDALILLYFKSMFKDKFLNELDKVKTVWGNALQFAEKNDKKVDLKNMTLKSFLNQGVTKHSLVKLTTNATLAPISEDDHCCENYITRGGYHYLVHKQERHFADNEYQRLKATEIATYFGEEKSAFLVQAYFKQCGKLNVQMYSSSYLFDNYYQLSLPTIDLQNRSYFTEKVKQQLKTLVPCLICFTIGVQEACDASELGHTLKQSKKAIFYGFSYALECGRSRMVGNGVRKKEIRVIDGKYHWNDTETTCTNKMWFCCKECRDRRCVLKEQQSGKTRLSKRRKIEKNTSKPHPAFSEFEHLSMSHGSRSKVADVLRTLCNVRASKKQRFTLTDGEIVTGVTLKEDAQELKVCLSNKTEETIVDTFKISASFK